MELTLKNGSDEKKLKIRHPELKEPGDFFFEFWDENGSHKKVMNYFKLCNMYDKVIGNAKS